MKTRIGHSSMVIDFLDVDFNSGQISTILKKEVENMLAKFLLKNVDDWTLVFRASYNNGRQPLVSKNRLGSYTSDKTKEITVVIPIPTIDTVFWGVEHKQHVYKESHFDTLIKNFHPLDIDYRNYNNRTDYILSCMREAILTTFSEGFTVNKEKIKNKKRNYGS